MTGWFSDALDAAQAKADEEEKLRQIQAQANAGDVPVAAQAPSPAGAFFGQQLSQPTYGPPQPTYQENVQAMAQQNPGAGQIAAGELGAADYYGSTAPVQASIAQRDQALQNFDQSGNGPFGIGNFDPVQAYNQIQESTRIPVWSDFAENVLGPAMNAAADPLGIQSYIQRNTLGTDIGAGDVALPVTGFDFATNLATGGGLTGFDDLARMGSTGLKTADNVFRGVPPEPGQVYRLGVQPESMIGVPDQNGLAASLGAMRVSDPAGARILQPDEPLLPGEREMWHGGLIKGPIRPDLYVSPAQRTAETFARNYGAFNAQPGLIERVTRAIMPEPNFTGGNFGAGIPPINPMGGEEAFGFGSRGGWREPLPPTTDLEGDLRRSLEARGVTPPPPEPPFPSAYPSIPEGTMGELFPDVVREQGVSASSPAARMGAPLAYDPQFMTPPPADAAMRDLGVAPVDDTAQQMRDAFQNVRRQEDILTGGGVPRVEPTQSTPPPVSTPPGPPTGGSGGMGGGPPPPAPPAGAPPPPQGGSPDEILQASWRVDPVTTGDSVRSTAKDVGVADDLAERIANDFSRNQQALNDVYSSPEGAARVQAGLNAAATRVEQTATGGLPDSFVNNVLNERTALTNQLTRAGVPPERITQVVEERVSKMVTDHYPNNPDKVADVQKQVANYEAKSKELAKDFRLFTAGADALKNTVAGVGDFAVLGQNLLTELFQATPYMALGTISRSVNKVASVLHHPELLGWERATGLPRVIAKEGAGITFNYGGEGMLTARNSPTIFGLAPKINPIAPLDKHVIQKVINANNKLQFEMIQGFAKDTISDGALTGEYLRKFAEGMVKNRGNVGAANDFAMNHISSPKVQRDIARFTMNATSATPKALAPGRRMAEDLLPFSASYTRSQFARMADIAKLGAPGASETQRVMAAQAILSGAVFMLGMYKFVNDKLGTTDANLDVFNTKPENGLPQPGQIILPGGRAVSLMPQASMRNMIVNATRVVVEGNPEDAKGILFRGGVGRESPWLSTVTRAWGYGYDTKGNFYSPFSNDGQKMPVDERIKGSVPVPFVAQGPLFNGEPVLSTGTALEAAGLNTYNERGSTTAYRERQQAADVRSQALVNGDLLRAAFPNDPVVAATLQGRSWDQLTFEEKGAITRVMPPEMRKQVEEADAASAAANKEKPTAIGNAIEIRKRTDEKIDADIQKIKQSAEPLVGQLFSADVDPRQVANTVSALRDIQQETLVRNLWAGSTTYTGLPWPATNNKEDLPSQIETAIAEYKMLGEVAKGADGKFNYDAYQAAKDGYLTSLAQKDPETANRLSFYIKEREAKTEANKPDIIKFYDFISDETAEYWKQPLGTRTEYRRDNPVVDAYLVLSGWIPELASGKAAQIFHEMAPQRPLAVAKNAR